MRVGIVGATGAVGQELLQVLEQRAFPIKELRLFASSRSVGKEFSARGISSKCRVLEKGCFEKLDFVFFDASDAISKEWAMEAAHSGAWVVDNSATYRMDPEVPLIVPEVNGHWVEERVKAAKLSQNAKFRIFAGPNCSTVQLVVPLFVLQKSWGIKRVVVSTYQSTSGAGAAAMEELKSQTQEYLNGAPSASRAFAHGIAFNAIPQIGGGSYEGYTSEEQKIMQESRKILDLPDLKITATAVRIPTLSTHGESVNVELKKAFRLGDVAEALKAQPGMLLQDDLAQKIYPMGNPGPHSQVEGASGRDAVYLGRLREDRSVEFGVNFWIVSDNLRKGAALNAVQIGEVIANANR